MFCHSVYYDIMKNNLIHDKYALTLGLNYGYVKTKNRSIYNKF